MSRVSDEIVTATDELRYSMRKLEERKDPWLPDALSDCFSDHAMGLIELVGNERANEIMSEAVITELGKEAWRDLRNKWIQTDISWVDMCAQALKAAGKEVP
jgi:hypothetical protein